MLPGCLSIGVYTLPASSCPLTLARNGEMSSESSNEGGSDSDTDDAESLSRNTDRGISVRASCETRGWETFSSENSSNRPHTTPSPLRMLILPSNNMGWS